MEHHLTADAECHLQYGITQCYLLPDTSEHTPASQAGTWFTYPGGIEGWVDLGDLSHTEMVYPPADGHPSTNQPGPLSINYVDRTQRVNHYTTPPLRIS